jgi:hypothetical protein
VKVSRATLRGGRLRGQAVFLSASVPSPARAQEFRRVEEAHLEIGEAVISLSRAVFAEGGTLVFGGHPSISPLVAMVAGEYLAPLRAEADGQRERPPVPIEIYQSRAFEGFLPDETLMMFRLGYANLHWIEAVDGERFDPEAPRDKPPCPKSTEEMRRRMIGETQPAAMVAIGGMEGIFDEQRIFREIREGAPVYTLASTGGAAALLAERRTPGVRAIDREILELLERRGEMVSRRGDQPAVPYALIVQALVHELIKEGSDGGR